MTCASIVTGCIFVTMLDIWAINLRVVTEVTHSVTPLDCESVGLPNTVCLSGWLFVCLSVVCLSICLSVSLSVLKISHDIKQHKMFELLK